MVNLLIVAHSAQLAAGVKEFVEEVTRGAVRVAAVGGAADGSLGTDVDRVRASLREIQTPDGVLVLVDFNSAVMSVEVALEESGGLPVVISDAPLVEGAYMAAVEASVGATLEETAAAALRAREMVKVHR
ncbi:MAG TPA: dihydroxyacetone kinase phosphoryl donor subunit DhaM [Roseiflexaceae bacterium]|nr:dihydroxyacetone kinase phosphoryl donor subunit DhaM [Roseiflexaceae bacterium]